MFNNYAQAAQFQDVWEQATGALMTIKMYADEDMGDWHALGFKWHEGNQSMCYSKGYTTMHLTDDKVLEIYQDSNPKPVTLRNVSYAFVGDLIDLIEGDLK